MLTTNFDLNSRFHLCETSKLVESKRWVMADEWSTARFENRTHTNCNTVLSKLKSDLPWDWDDWQEKKNDNCYFRVKEAGHDCPLKTHFRCGATVSWPHKRTRELRWKNRRERWSISKEWKIKRIRRQSMVREMNLSWWTEFRIYSNIYSTLEWWVNKELQTDRVSLEPKCSLTLKSNSERATFSHVKTTAISVSKI